MNIPVGAGFACPNAPTIHTLMHLGGQTPPLRLNERAVYKNHLLITFEE